MQRKDVEWACGLYAIWQILYYAKTEIIDRGEREGTQGRPFHPIEALTPRQLSLIC